MKTFAAICCNSILAKITTATKRIAKNTLKIQVPSQKMKADICVFKELLSTGADMGVMGGGDEGLVVWLVLLCFLCFKAFLW